MTIVGVIGLDAPMTVEELRTILAERLLAHPRFSMEFATNSWGRLVLRPAESFDITDHVRAVAAPVDEAAFQGFLSGLASGLLPQGRPPWEVLIVEDYRGKAQLVARLHHSLADGISLIQVLVSLCDEPDDSVSAATAGSDRGGSWLVRAWRVLTAAIRLALKPPDPATSLKSPVTGTKNVAWSQEFDLGVLKASARSRGATLNDLLTAAVAEALAGELASRGEAHDVLRAMVPFNLRPPIVGQPLGNQFGLVIPALPVGPVSQDERLALVRSRMAELRETAEGTAAYVVLNFMGLTARIVESAIVWFFGKKSSLVMTNVPGPRQTLRFGGRAIDRLMFWVPQSGGIAVGISVISYAGQVTVGVLADEASLEDPKSLVRRVEQALEDYSVPVEPVLP